ncbi:helix-turn-helix domain-containing protein [Streptomyces sp. H10-C2]|uniref:helix-turn-helix domain-containing protein n=1 Tax=unclassified Streptomyces TaxID=2593676 RepID=UPI0024BAFFE2|nr:MULTISPECIES: helix-turn-helix domain-containing protein [unclassified Streptomyces]MDJ0342219.1 helix-turn-helix domain-containing protein [Streptomyces sp. PH10-H1]MDJ0368733.1 helix-turn-helix domain-containing protein [Streptomyces sp. H10-C2]
MTGTNSATGTCPHGHDRATNLRVRGDGRRYCRACHRAEYRAWFRKQFDLKHPGHPFTLTAHGHRRCQVCTVLRSSVDTVAVERAAAGDPPARLYPAEREAAVLRLRRHELPVPVIAARVGCSERTVWRIFARTGSGQYGSAA